MKHIIIYFYQYSVTTRCYRLNHTQSSYYYIYMYLFWLTKSTSWPTHYLLNLLSEVRLIQLLFLRYVTEKVPNRTSFSCWNCNLITQINTWTYITTMQNWSVYKTG